MKDILIVVDMQKDFIDGSLGTKEAQGIVDNVKNKVDAYLKEKKTVIYTQDTHEEGYLDTFEGRHLPVVHCVEGTEGWKIDPSLPDGDGCKTVKKRTFGYLEWKELLSSAESIEICGLCTDICVISNALIIRAIYPDKEISVDPKCCAGVTPELHEAALKVMASCQIDVE